MTITTQLCNFKTSDNERLHGLLFTPQNRQSDLALLFVHGVAMNFYLPPLSIFGQELAERGFHSFVINTRGHDWISRAGNLTKFGGSAYENLGDCFSDRKSTRLNSSHEWISYAVFCLKKKSQRQAADVRDYASRSAGRQ